MRRRLFEQQIRELLAANPPGKLDESGAPFWGGTRLLPSPAAFDAAEPTHLDFVAAAAALKARTLGLAPPPREAVAAAARGVGALEPPPPPGAMLRAVAAAEAAARAAGGAAAAFGAAEEAFEKDDDANGHVAFVTAASNLRAVCYGLEPADEHKTKLVAGRIVPAIATATAAAVGLVAVELLKLAAAGAAPAGAEAFRNSYLNLALPLVALSEPEPPETFRLPASADGARGEAWSEWSRVEVDGGGGELRLSQLVARLEERFGHEVSFLSTSGGMLLYSPLSPPASQQRWLSMGVGAAVDEALGGGRGGDRLVQLQASLYDEESEEDVEAPPILYRRRD